MYLSVLLFFCAYCAAAAVFYIIIIVEATKPDTQISNKKLNRKD